MKMPWKRKVYRGKSKSPEVKAREAQSKIDEFLARSYLKFLQSHPQYTEVMARQKMEAFDQMVPGMETIGTDRDTEGTDFVEKIKEVKSAMELMRTEFGASNDRSGLTGLLKDILASDREGALAGSIANLVSALSGGVRRQQHYEELPFPEPEPEKQIQQPKQEPTEQETAQTALYEFVEGALRMNPSEVADYIWSNQDSDNLGGVAFQYWMESGKDIDVIVETLPTLIPPEYEFLRPLLPKIDRKWLALIADRLNVLETQANIPEIHIGLSDTKEIPPENMPDIHKKDENHKQNDSKP